MLPVTRHPHFSTHFCHAAMAHFGNLTCRICWPRLCVPGIHTHTHARTCTHTVTHTCAHMHTAEAHGTFGEGLIIGFHLLSLFERFTMSVETVEFSIGSTHLINCEFLFLSPLPSFILQASLLRPPRPAPARGELAQGCAHGC